MTLRTDLLPDVDVIRGLRGPLGVDIQTVSLTIIQRTWTGGRRGAGTFADTVLHALPQKYKIREVSEKLVASSGGRYVAGDVRVGPITPDYGSGGYTPEDLAPSGQQGAEIIHVLAGTIAGDYTAIDVDSARAFSYYLILRRMGAGP